jgi:hypothetical protein
VKFISLALRHARRSDQHLIGAKFAPLTLAPHRKLMGANASGRKRSSERVRTRLESPPDENSAARQIESGKAASGKMMVSDGKKIKANLAPKTESPPEKKTESPPEKKTESPPQKKGTSADPPKAESGDSAAASSYSRGEGQKPVSKAYKDNWNAIFAKKKKR